MRNLNTVDIKILVTFLNFTILLIFSKIWEIFSFTATKKEKEYQLRHQKLQKLMTNFENNERNNMLNNINPDSDKFNNNNITFKNGENTDERKSAKRKTKSVDFEASLDSFALANALSADFEMSEDSSEASLSPTSSLIFFPGSTNEYGKKTKKHGARKDSYILLNSADNSQSSSSSYSSSKSEGKIKTITKSIGDILNKIKESSFYNYTMIIVNVLFCFALLMALGSSKEKVYRFSWFILFFLLMISFNALFLFAGMPELENENDENNKNNSNSPVGFIKTKNLHSKLARFQKVEEKGEKIKMKSM